MFKGFFTAISNKVKKFAKKIYNSKVVKIVAKVLGIAGAASVVVTAYRMGNINEAVRAMTKEAVDISFFDGARWFMEIIRNSFEEFRNKNINWGVRNFFIPFVGAVTYLGQKILRNGVKFVSWLRSIKVISTDIQEETEIDSQDEFVNEDSTVKVVDVF